MSAHGSWQIILTFKEDDENLNSGILLCLQESMSQVTEPLWSMITSTFSGTVQHISGLRLITRIFLGVFICGTLLLLFEPHDQFATDSDLEMPPMEIQHYQMHLPLDAIEMSSELKGNLRQNSVSTQGQKEFLRFYVNDTLSQTSSDSTSSERSGKGLTKKDQRKNDMRGDSANAASSSRVEAISEGSTY